MRASFWDWVLMTVRTSWGCSLQMGKGKKGDQDWLWEDYCSNLSLSLKTPSANNKTLQRTFGNLKEELWKSSKFSICRNAFILFMFVISALKLPSGWCSLAWSDFNPLQKACLNFPLLTSQFFFASNESFLFQGKKKSQPFFILSCNNLLNILSPPMWPSVLEPAVTSQWEILAHGNLALTPWSKSLSLEKNSSQSKC